MGEEKTDEKKEGMEVDTKEPEEPKDTPPTADVKENVDVIVAETMSSKKLLEGVERLLLAEKKQRQAEHEANTLYCAKAMVDMIYGFKNWKIMAEQITVMCKRRSQFRKVITRIVQKAMAWLDEIASDEPNQLLLLDALLGVAEGKIYVEVERARLTLRLSKIKEKNGDLAGASKTLQELQIETFGSMEKEEKCKFLLEQMRLCLANMDFIRCGLIRNKITKKAIQSFPVLEQKYCEYSLVQHYNKDENYLEMAQGYRRLLDLYPEEERKLTCLSNAVYAVCLAEHAPEQQTLLHTLNDAPPSDVIGKLLEKVPAFRALLKFFCTPELISYPSPTFAELQSFELEGIKEVDQAAKNADKLKQRVMQHNIRVIAGYYTEIRAERLAELICADLSSMEKELCAMVTSGALWARIDRVAKIVRFFKKETPSTVLNNWRQDIDQLLGLVNTMCHQIHKEMMLARA